MRNSFCLAAAVCVAILALSSADQARAQQPATMKIEAPEITGIQEWINSKPLKLKDLRGKVVVLHFWTFG
jgi:cytochrome oxidase Cu insertion factor (SCO1/SenC/PrrC family)